MQEKQELGSSSNQNTGKRFSIGILFSVQNGNSFLPYTEGLHCLIQYFIYFLFTLFNPASSAAPHIPLSRRMLGSKLLRLRHWMKINGKK
jgi:hypothetical protein